MRVILSHQGDAQIAVSMCVGRVDLDGPSVRPDGFFQLSLLPQRIAEIVQGQAMVEFELEYLVEGVIRFFLLSMLQHDDSDWEVG